MIRVSRLVLEKVTSSYGRFFESIARLPAEKCARDVLDETKVHDQVAVLCETTGMRPEDLRGKKVLEVGSGFGIFVNVTRRDYSCETVGLEPAEQGFDTSFELGRQILAEYGTPPDAIIDAKGESMPFPDGTFDLVYSSTVLEHTDDPKAVIREALRVLKPGGCMQFVFPNYASFFEGHYAIPWIPYMNNRLGAAWVRLFGRDPSFMRGLKLLTYRKVRRWMHEMPEAEVLTYGQGVFTRRMRDFEIRDWAGLGKLRAWIGFVRRLRLVGAVTKLMVAAGSFEPIVLTVVKRHR